MPANIISVEIQTPSTEKPTKEQLEKYAEMLDSAIRKILKEGDKDGIAIIGTWAKIKEVE